MKVTDEHYERGLALVRQPEAWAPAPAHAGFLAGVEALRAHAQVPAATVLQTDGAYARLHASDDVVAIASAHDIPVDEAEDFAYGLLALVGQARARHKGGPDA